MTTKPITAPHVLLQRQATECRVLADGLRQQAELLDLKAARLEERLEKLGLKSWYCGKLPPRDQRAAS